MDEPCTPMTIAVVGAFDGTVIANVTVVATDPVIRLRRIAEDAAGSGLKLMHGSSVLEDTTSIADTELTDQDRVLAVKVPKVSPRLFIPINNVGGAFAYVNKEYLLVTGGVPGNGGNSSSIRERVTSGIRELKATHQAFAAITMDDSVVAWGHPAWGGDASSVQEQLRVDVLTLHSTGAAFAALRADGSVVTWGAPNFGGRMARVRIKDSGLGPVAGHFYGPADAAGFEFEDEERIQAQLSSGVTGIYENSCKAFAGLKEDDTVVAWGCLADVHQVEEVVPTKKRTCEAAIHAQRMMLELALEHAEGNWMELAGDIKLGSAVRTLKRVPGCEEFDLPEGCEGIVVAVDEEGHAHITFSGHCPRPTLVHFLSSSFCCLAIKHNNLPICDVQSCQLDAFGSPIMPDTCLTSRSGNGSVAGERCQCHGVEIPSSVSGNM